MALFNVAREWIILSPAGVRAAGAVAEDLAVCIAALRGHGGLGRTTPPIADAGGPAPSDSASVILLNAGDSSPDRSAGGRRNGFTWRAAQDRVEIYGDSDRGLCNGVFDFLSNLGLRWPAPGREELPDPAGRGEYQLANDRACVPSEDAPESRRRVIIERNAAPKKRNALIRWAVRNRADALVFSLGDRVFRHPRGRDPFAPAERYAMIVEAGGWDLSLLVPRRYFFLHRDLFRMDAGKRVRRFNFCPTNPRTVALIRKQGKRRFGALLRLHPEIGTFHLWPDRGHETAWCSCPACRAFSQAEQNRMALCAAADALAEIAPAARLSFLEEAGCSPESAANALPLRPNLFRLGAAPCL
jgi:hypothetical protein